MDTPPPKPPRPYAPAAPHVLDLDTLPPRIVHMVQALLKHQQVLTTYETGQLSLNWNGPHVRANLGNVCLDSERPQT
jgi:hypothetical protein